MPTGRELPKGIVTFAFTDIEGSTRLMRRLGDRYPAVAERHLALMSRGWRAHGGHEISSTGDSAFLAFQEPTAAVRACAEAQHRLAIEPWPDGLPVRVRMGVHSGLAFPRADDYLALAVNQAVRVMSAAHGGQVLVSAETVNLLAAVDDVALIPLGRFRLRDFDEPVQLFALSEAGNGAAFPAVRALPADGHNLVAPPTPLFGRHGDVAELADRLRPGNVLTLTGPGGVGKTRLAIEVGLAVAPKWPDGVWMADLAPLHDASLIGSTIGEALGVPSRGADRWAEVLEHLRGRHAVLVVDNCEAFRAGCAAVVDDLLAACPDTAVLATSREPLKLLRESVWHVDPLPLPKGDVTTASAAVAAPAVELFLDRAHAIGRPLALDKSTVATIVEICRRLDGLPLALELAAARLAVLQPAEVLDGLNDRFRLLRSRMPTMPERQQTLQGLLEWSERLLTDSERLCLRRLGVFGSSFTVHAASAAASGDGVDEYEVPELVWSLVDKSLVTADLTANETRYRLLESVRDFAGRRLAEHGETDGIAGRLATWYLERIGPTRRQIRGWTGETGVELGNLRALVPLLATAAPELAQTLAFTIGRYLDAVHSYQEGIDELARYADELSTPTPARISLLCSLGDLYLRLADVASAEKMVSVAEVVRDEVGTVPDWDDVAIERTRGDLACRLGDNALAVDAAERMLAGEISLRGRARMCSQLGIASTALGDFDTAWDAFQRELDAYQRLGDEVFEASAEGNLAEVALRRADHAAAARHQRACLARALELGASVMVAFSLIVAARLAARRGAWEMATTLHGHADVILDRTGIALYDEDRRLSDEMLDAARQQLGDAAFATARASGRSLDLPAAASLADRVLGAAAAD